MKNISFLKNLLFAFAAVAAVVACDDEYSELGSDVVDGDIHNNLTRTYAQLVAYDRPLGPVQINGLDVNYLGVLDSPIFGKTTASYITQAQLGTVNPSFTSNPVIDSVWVYVPYNAVTDSVTYDSNNVKETHYSLIDCYGSDDENQSFRLKIRRNNVYLRSNDASSGGSETQFYYSDDNTLLANQGVSLLANNADDVEAKISDKQVLRLATYVHGDDTTATVDTVETLAPGVFQYLNPQRFQEILLGPGAQGMLVNNNVFKDYFRGISFTAEQIGSNSRIVAPKFASGYIKITYDQDDLDSDGNLQYEDTAHTIIKREHLSLTINLTGTHVNVLQNENGDQYLNAVNSSDEVNGDDRLYIKGGAGSMATVQISQADINALKEISITGTDTIGALINQASLKVYVDRGSTPLSALPPRIYLYDLDNKRTLYDYYLDGTTSLNARASKYVYDGILKDSSTPYYRINLTNHINNLVRKDSTNIRLGLVLTNDIAVTSNAMLRTPFTLPAILGGNAAFTVKTVPTAHINHPQGVVLYGSNIPVGDPDYGKRMRLEIFYTKRD